MNLLEMFLIWSLPTIVDNRKNWVNSERIDGGIITKESVPSGLISATFRWFPNKPSKKSNPNRLL